MTLMVSVIHNNRAIPIAWITVKGSKGHLPEDVHLKLLNKVKLLIPDETDVIFLGDGEFDGNRLQAVINSEENWEYVCRTAKNRLVDDDGDSYSLRDFMLVSGMRIDLPNVKVTADKYGSVLVIIWWDKKYKEPIYLVTNMKCPEEACRWYTYRFIIETFFLTRKVAGLTCKKAIYHPQSV